MKVEQFYNKNQFRIYGEGKNIFQSYDSTIAIIEEGMLILGLHWDYSKTTLKHLYMFLSDYYFEIDNYNHISKALHSNNKRKAIQNLIDNNIIVYDESLI